MNLDENYRHYNLKAFANISKNIKFSENLQPCYILTCLEFLTRKCSNGNPSSGCIRMGQSRYHVWNGTLNPMLAHSLELLAQVPGGLNTSKPGFSSRVFLVCIPKR